MKNHARRKRHTEPPPKKPGLPGSTIIGVIAGAAVLIVVFYFLVIKTAPPTAALPGNAVSTGQNPVLSADTGSSWIRRAYEVGRLFHAVYTPCWEGAYGAIGDAYLFGATGDSSLLRFHLIDHNLTRMCEGTWVDDRAWVCLAELTWWKFTGRRDRALVDDARRRYLEARSEGRLSDFEGFWSWYNYPPAASAQVKIFTNSNMNQMVAVACGLYEATMEKQFLRDALLVWHGDSLASGIEQTLYRGNGRWVGRPGLAAFGKEIPWDGADYASIGAALYKATGDPNYKEIVVATVRRVMDPATGWVDPVDFYQIRMDGNGAFVNFLLDAYAIAPDQLPGIPSKIGKMLQHVWSNHAGTSRVTLRREGDNGIRNGWNPYGGEDGYNVDEVGTVHAQGEAMRAFGTYAYYVAMSGDKKNAERNE